MDTDPTDPFLDLGYTSPEEAEHLHVERLKKVSSMTVRQVAKVRRRYGRPPVGEDQELLNVDMAPTPLTNDEAKAQEEGVWTQREQLLIAELERKLAATEDVSKRALLRKELDARTKRWHELGREPLQQLLPDMPIPDSDTSNTEP